MAGVHPFPSVVGTRLRDVSYDLKQNGAAVMKRTLWQMLVGTLIIVRGYRATLAWLLGNADQSVVRR